MTSAKSGRGEPRLPPPAAEFAKCTPPLLKNYREQWWRLAARARPSLIDWDDRKVSRFSHPALPFKILYLADEKETAFWEVFGTDIEDMDVDNRALSVKAQLEPRKWAHFPLAKDLRLIDVTHPKTIHDLRSNAAVWLAPYEFCQEWAKALMEHPAKLDGFIYQSCRAGGTSRCLALFSRPDAAAMETRVGAKDLIDPALNKSIVDDPDVLNILLENNIDRR